MSEIIKQRVATPIKDLNILFNQDICHKNLVVMNGTDNKVQNFVIDNLRMNLENDGSVVMLTIDDSYKQFCLDNDGLYVTLEDLKVNPFLTTDDDMLDEHIVNAVGCFHSKSLNIHTVITHLLEEAESKKLTLQDCINKISSYMAKDDDNQVIQDFINNNVLQKCFSEECDTLNENAARSLIVINLQCAGMDRYQSLFLLQVVLMSLTNFLTGLPRLKNKLVFCDKQISELLVEIDGGLVVAFCRRARTANYNLITIVPPEDAYKQKLPGGVRVNSGFYLSPLDCKGSWLFENRCPNLQALIDSGKFVGYQYFLHNSFNRTYYPVKFS